jgi:hypothetical protein
MLLEMIWIATTSKSNSNFSPQSIVWPESRFYTELEICPIECSPMHLDCLPNNVLPDMWYVDGWTLCIPLFGCFLGSHTMYNSYLAIHCNTVCSDSWWVRGSSESSIYIHVGPLVSCIYRHNNVYSQLYWWPLTSLMIWPLIQMQEVPG